MSTRLAILKVLESLGAELVFVPPMLRNVLPHLWSYMVIEDESVDYFLIRNTSHRFTDRESSAIDNWLANSWPMYGIRDLKIFQDGVLTEGLWGGYSRMIWTLMGRIKVTDLLIEKYSILNNNDRMYLAYSCRNSIDRFLQNCLAPFMLGHIYFHDRFQCEPANNKYPVPADDNYDTCQFWPKQYKEECPVSYIGQQYTAFHEPSAVYYKGDECT